MRTVTQSVRSVPTPQVWAEKEMRNLMRLRQAGINAPAPIQVRGQGAHARACVLAAEVGGMGRVVPACALCTTRGPPTPPHPTPDSQLRMHVLVMEFVGEDAVAAPRLRDAGLPLERLRSAYTEMVLIVRNLYQRCKLVHADLSEYNILYHKVRRYGGWAGGVWEPWKWGARTEDTRTRPTRLTAVRIWAAGPAVPASARGGGA